MMYRPISDYAVIANTQTTAVISSRGTIEWACLPHFDSPVTFARLLEETNNGH